MKLAVCVSVFALTANTVLSEEAVNFNRDIRPILANNCFRCHGPDAETREAGLRLDQFDAATKELDSGDRAIVPGDVGSSQIMARIHSDDEDLRMPPADLGPPLTDAEVALLEQWVQPVSYTHLTLPTICSV